MRKVLVSQAHSAQYRAELAGIRHGSKVTANVVVGVTPAGTTRRATVAHFCPSRVVVKSVKAHGEGSIPDCPVDFPNGLPLVDRAAFLQLDATVVSNGTLRFCTPRNVRMVPIPPSSMSNSPWAWDGGAEEVAEDLGCSSVDEMFEKHGVALC
ncbi:hypothetical protein AUJ46_05455 [Candidatus Peregrinibacteria bacterium CG1_02_54_53]|nr:MAG: hypothetical protein AUJ46_05455 [Candidatus Peregrinibacteria bacterium CG1_02_54_53]